jgi:hypothetical protein
MDKQCSTCGEIKSIHEYWIDKHSPDGHYNVCKACKVVQQQARQTRNRNNRAQLSIHSRVCHECGEEKNIDHFGYRIARPDGYSYVCRSCLANRRKTYANTKIRTEKCCNVCKKVLPIDMFHKNKTTPDGHQDVCPSCMLSVRRGANKDKIEAFSAIKASMKCSQCGETYHNCLSFHHRDPAEKDINISRARTMSYARLMAEIEKCDILCENCHRKLHYPEQSHRTLMWKWGLKEGRSCQICGESHYSCLDFHHRDSATKLFGINKIQQMAGITKQLALDEIDKCDVLCRNCHIKLHAKEKGQIEI